MNSPKPSEWMVHKSLKLNAPRERVFEVFTRSLDRWWPRSHHIGPSPSFKALMDDFEGGRWYELGSDGGETNWGQVLAWEPPTRLLLSWDVNAEWQYDAAIATIVELQFLPDGVGNTRLDLEHRGFERYGEKAATMLAMFDSEGGWSGILAELPKALQA